MRLADSELQVLLNSEDISSTVADVNDTNSQSLLVIIERVSTDSILFSFSNDIGTKITASMGLLSFVLSVPQEFEGKSSGLLGNFNGDDSDDFKYSNGTLLDSTANDRMIHDFGQSCEFVFTYIRGSYVLRRLVHREQV